MPAPRPGCRHLLSFLVVGLVLAGCAEKTEHEQLAGLRDGFTYRQYRQLSENGLPAAYAAWTVGSEWADPGTVPPPFSPEAECLAHALLGYSALTADRGTLAIAEADIITALPACNDLARVSAALRAVAFQRLEWPQLAREESDLATFGGARIGSPDAQRDSTQALVIHVVLGYAALSDRNPARAQIHIDAIALMLEQPWMSELAGAGLAAAASLAAAGLGSALHTVLLMMSLGLLLGMSPLVSQAFGAGDHPAVRRVLLQGLWLASIVSVPLVIYNLFGEDLANLFAQPAEVAVLTGGYMAALAGGVPAFLLFTAGRQYLEGMGRTTAPMVITLLGLGTNIVANRVFIHGVQGWIEPMGVVGAGWATTLVRWTMVLLMAAYLIGRTHLNPFREVSRRPDRATLGRIVRIGAPTGGQMGMEVGLFSLAAVMMGWIGTVELGSHQVTINIAATTFMVALGTSMAGSIRVGMLTGARRPAGVRRAVAVTYVVSIGFMGICALAFVAIPGVLLGFYTSDPGILALGRQLLFMAALFQLFDGAQVAGFSVLRGAADTRVPMLLAMVSFWCVGAPAAYLLGFHTPLGAVGIWAGLCLGLLCAAILLLRRVRHVLWDGPLTLAAPVG